MRSVATAIGFCCKNRKQLVLDLINEVVVLKCMSLYCQISPRSATSRGSFASETDCRGFYYFQSISTVFAIPLQLSQTNNLIPKQTAVNCIIPCWVQQIPTQMWFCLPFHQLNELVPETPVLAIEQLAISLRQIPK